MDRSSGEHGYGLILAYLIGAIVEIFFYDFSNKHWWGGFLWIGISSIIFFIWIIKERWRNEKRAKELIERQQAYMKRPIESTEEYYERLKKYYK